MGTQERRERERLERRQTILDAARSLFWKRGYDKTTMPAIARTAELAPGTLYLYFPNKDSLYLELLLEGYELLHQRLSQGVGRGLPPERQAQGLIDSFFTFAKDYPEYFDIIFFVIQKEHQGGWEETFDKEQLIRIEGKLASCKAVATEVLANLHPGRDTLELTKTVDSVWSMLAGVIFFFRRSKGLEAFNALTDEARRLILEGILH